MDKIRRSTNWDDPVAAKKANEEIKKLAKQMIIAGNVQTSNVDNNQQGQNANTEDIQKMNELNQQMIDQKMDIYEQIWKAAAGGENADILLAEPLRKEIAEEFKEDDDKTVKSQEFMDKINYLLLDMSMPGIDMVIDAMPSYKGITTLIITTRKTVLSVDLQKILENAKGYPLKELYIINLGSAVGSLPSNIGSFTRLTTLGLFKNNIKEIPVSVSKLLELRTLYVDLNPLNTIVNVVTPLNKLEKLGIGKTNIQDSEIQKLKQVLTGCKILIE